MEESREEVKRAAAVAAVLRYLQARAGQGRRAAPPGAGGPAGGGTPSPWALYGRRALMDQRIRMQARRRP
jgi:hypothetical protein